MGCTLRFPRLRRFHPLDLCAGVLVAAAIRLTVYVKGKNAKKFRKNTEYGSARWGTHEDIAPYIDADARNNVILTQTEKLTMNNRPKDPKTARNKNVLVIGGSGSGKTRFWLKPNLMQCNSEKYPCSFVVTDPKGSVVVECGKMLRRFGYRIKIFNTSCRTARSAAWGSSPIMTREAPAKRLRYARQTAGRGIEGKELP